MSEFLPLGHFYELDSNGRVRLSECPICALDPDSDPYVFSHKEGREAHFSNDHDADDIGRPLAELLPEAGDDR